MAMAFVSGCSLGSAGDDERLQVFAASVLTDALPAVARGFEERNPGVRVSMSFAGSPVLGHQIAAGAPADVFLSGHHAHLESLEAAGHIRGSGVFAGNELVVIVPLDNPAGIESFVDLSRAKGLVLGQDQTPIGIYTRELLDRAEVLYGPDFARGVRDAAASMEANVRLVRAKVELGEAGAAVVYRSDAESSRLVRAITIPEEINVRADYHAAAVASSPRADLSERFVAYLESAEAQRTFEAHGLLPLQ